MSVVVWLGLGITTWLIIAVAIAVRVGKNWHRDWHRDGTVDLRSCPSWCVRERGAAVLQAQRNARGSR